MQGWFEEIDRPSDPETERALLWSLSAGGWVAIAAEDYDEAPFPAERLGTCAVAELSPPESHVSDLRHWLGHKEWMLFGSLATREAAVAAAERLQTMTIAKLFPRKRGAGAGLFGPERRRLIAAYYDRDVILVGGPVGGSLSRVSDLIRNVGSADELTEDERRLLIRYPRLAEFMMTTLWTHADGPLLDAFWGWVVFNDNSEACVDELDRLAGDRRAPDEAICELLMKECGNRFLHDGADARAFLLMLSGFLREQTRIHGAELRIGVAQRHRSSVDGG